MAIAGAGRARTVQLAQVALAEQQAAKPEPLLGSRILQQRPGQSIAAVMQYIQRDNAAGPTWRLPVKNNSASAVGPLTPIPRPLVWALDEYLPVRTHKAPHSTLTEGPLLVSRTGRGLDHVTFTRLLREVAATHPDLEEIAPTLHPDVVAHSPSPFADERGVETGRPAC